MAEVNEGSTAYLTATFRDKAGAEAAPSAVSYRIDCLTTGTAVRGATSVGATASVEITLTPTDNAIQAGGNTRETKRVTVTGTYGASDKVVDEYDYDVVNLKFAP